jgi:transcriptional regulator with XRE-family HTH domain
MSEGAIGQRLKVLIFSLGMNVRSFCKAIDVSETTVRNYFNRGSSPSAEFLTKLNNTYGVVNLGWLLTGNGSIFLPDDITPNQSTNITNKKNKGPVQNNTGEHASITNNVKLDDCQRDLEASRKEVAGYQREIELLKGQLEDKNEIITLLRGGYNRPN